MRVVTCAGNGINTRSKVLHNGTSASLDSQDAGHLQDHILGGGPSLQGTSQLNTNNLEKQEFGK